MKLSFSSSGNELTGQMEILAIGSDEPIYDFMLIFQKQG